MPLILALHGPNLNLLGIREPDKYGHQSLDDINRGLVRQAQTAGYELVHLQSNSESALIDRIHAARDDGTVFILFNPAAYTHSSVALRDALLGVAIPFIEIHLSNVHQREPFRQHSYFSDVAAGVITGLGAQGYELGLQAAIRHIENNQEA